MGVEWASASILLGMTKKKGCREKGMRLNGKIICTLLSIALLVLVVCFAVLYLRDLFAKLGDASTLHMPADFPWQILALFIIFPIASIALATFLVLRSTSKIRREEEESEEVEP